MSVFDLLSDQISGRRTNLKQETKDEVKHIIRGLYDCSYYNRKIIHINNELEAIDNRLLGVSSPCIKEYIIENHKPFTQKDKLELILKEEEKINLREKYANKILKYESLIESLDDEIKRFVVELYILQKKHSEVAYDHHYSRQALYDKINRAIAKSLTL